eukprot:4058860-Pyramimonas_sp.AAC.1
MPCHGTPAGPPSPRLPTCGRRVITLSFARATPGPILSPAHAASLRPPARPISWWGSPFYFEI